MTNNLIEWTDYFLFLLIILLKHVQYFSLALSFNIVNQFLTLSFE